MTGLTRFFVLCILPPALGFTLPEHGMMTAMMRQQAAAEANPEAFLGSFLSGRGLEASLQALRESPSRSCVRSGGTGVLSSGEIEALRRHCDRSILCASSPTGDDCVVVNDITGARRDLARLLCDATVQELCALPQLLLGLRENEVEEEELEVACVLMRRYRSPLASPPPPMAAEEELSLSFPFHTDDHSVTVNIALTSSPSHHTGGDLIALYGGACRRHSSRREGDVIVHRGAVAHAVRRPAKAFNSSINQSYRWSHLCRLIALLSFWTVGMIDAHCYPYWIRHGN